MGPSVSRFRSFFFFFFFTSGKLSWAPASAVTFYCFGSSRALLCVAVPSLPPSSVSVSSCFVPGRLELFVPFLPFQLFSSISSVPFISFFFFFGCAGSWLPHRLLSGWGARALGLGASGAAAHTHRLRCSEALGLFPTAGIEPVSSALAGEFFTTEPPERP